MIMHVLGGTDRETGELVLIGDEPDLRQLVRLLREQTRGEITLDPVAAEPGLRPITALLLHAGDGPIMISAADDIATITGSSSSYEDIAVRIELFMEYNDLSKPGMHMHVDASSGLIGGESMELIVAGPVPNS
jgi:hypothetical protein